MGVQLVAKDDTSILNYCSKLLAREPGEPRHNFGQFEADDARGQVAESWRFPLIDGHSDGIDFDAAYQHNEVTFVYRAEPTPTQLAVVGTFANLWQPIPLRRIGDTPFHCMSVVVPKGEVHRYKFLVDGTSVVDPINPQREALDNGAIWSRFFTQLASEPVSFERWEIAILARLTAHILPFETADAANFLSRFYDHLDLQARSAQYAHAYRLDQPVGVVNFIDKLLAREENHRLIDYRICLREIDRVLRLRNPYVEPHRMSKEMYRALYEQMAAGAVPGWDHGRYGSPRFFLQLLRRHAFTGAFSHPKYGGNAGAAGWAYLEDKYRDDQGRTLFDWRRVLEKPLGTSADYHG